MDITWQCIWNKERGNLHYIGYCANRNTKYLSGIHSFFIIEYMKNNWSFSQAIFYLTIKGDNYEIKGGLKNVLISWSDCIRSLKFLSYPITFHFHKLGVLLTMLTLSYSYIFKTSDNHNCINGILTDNFWRNCATQ